MIAWWAFTEQPSEFQKMDRRSTPSISRNLTWGTRLPSALLQETFVGLVDFTHRGFGTTSRYPIHLWQTWFEPFKQSSQMMATSELPLETHHPFVQLSQELVSCWFKQWRIFHSVYQMDTSIHYKNFAAIAVITQLAINNGKKLSQMDYIN